MVNPGYSNDAKSIDYGKTYDAHRCEKTVKLWVVYEVFYEYAGRMSSR